MFSKLLTELIGLYSTLPRRDSHPLEDGIKRDAELRKFLESENLWPPNRASDRLCQEKMRDIELSVVSKLISPRSTDLIIELSDLLSRNRHTDRVDNRGLQDLETILLGVMAHPFVEKVVKHFQARRLGLQMAVGTAAAVGVEAVTPSFFQMNFDPFYRPEGGGAKALMEAYERKFPEIRGVEFQLLHTVESQRFAQGTIIDPVQHKLASSKPAILDGFRHVQKNVLYSDLLERLSSSYDSPLDRACTAIIESSPAPRDVQHKLINQIRGELNRKRGNRSERERLMDKWIHTVHQTPEEAERTAEHIASQQDFIDQFLFVLQKFMTPERFPELVASAFSDSVVNALSDPKSEICQSLSLQLSKWVNSMTPIVTERLQVEKEGHQEEMEAKRKVRDFEVKVPPGSVFVIFRSLLPQFIHDWEHIKAYNNLYRDWGVRVVVSDYDPKTPQQLLEALEWQIKNRPEIAWAPTVGVSLGVIPWAPNQLFDIWPQIHDNFGNRCLHVNTDDALLNVCLVYTEESQIVSKHPTRTRAGSLSEHYMSWASRNPLSGVLNVPPNLDLSNAAFDFLKEEREYFEFCESENWDDDWEELEWEWLRYDTFAPGKLTKQI